MPDLSYEAIVSLLGSAKGMRWKSGAYRGKINDDLTVLMNTLNGFGAPTSAITYHITGLRGKISIWGCVDNIEAPTEEGKRICLDERVKIYKTVFNSPKFQCIVRTTIDAAKTDDIIMRAILTCV